MCEIHNHILSSISFFFSFHLYALLHTNYTRTSIYIYIFMYFDAYFWQFNLPVIDQTTDDRPRKNFSVLQSAKKLQLPQRNSGDVSASIRAFQQDGRIHRRRLQKRIYFSEPSRQKQKQAERKICVGTAATEVPARVINPGRKYPHDMLWNQPNCKSDAKKQA